MSNLVEVQAYQVGDCFSLTFPRELPVLPDVVRVKEAAEMMKAVELTEEFNSARDYKMEEWRWKNYKEDHVAKLREKK